VIAATALGAAVSIISTLLLLPVGYIRFRRTARPVIGKYLLTIVTLVVSAVIEEALFRVGLIALVQSFASDAVAVVASAVLFGVIHAIRGSRPEERVANVVTSVAFGALLGAAWLDGWAFADLVGFHAAFNIVGGMLLGSASLNPVSNRDDQPTEVWPLAQEQTRPFEGWTATAVLALSEVLPFAACAGLVLR
jgi:membrane protease YdiL (CAAX protease family)